MHMRLFPRLAFGDLIAVLYGERGMPFYLRKSISAGPFRFNFSKGGVGVSVGVKGLRFGTGPRGHYVHAGRGGLYYRASLNPAGRRQPAEETLRQPQKEPVIFEAGGVELIEIESADVELMRESSFQDVLSEINSKRNKMNLTFILSAFVVVGALISGLAVSPEWLGLALIAFPAGAIGGWFDAYRRTAVLFYEFDDAVETAYREMSETFDILIACKGKWHIEAGGEVRDLTTWKRNAGASHIVKKKPTRLVYKLPKGLNSNVTPPAIYVGKQTLYFFPDVLLVEQGSQIGAVGYASLSIRWQESNFIEDGEVPSDAKIIRYTWQHPNKSGEPDRRFKNNRQIPVCRYEVMHLKSGSGLNELVEFSKSGVVARFEEAVKALPKSQESRELTPTGLALTAR